METNRTLAAVLALLADNTAGDISPQDIRDLVVSLFANYGIIGVAGGSTTQVTNATPGTFDKVTGFTTDGISAGAVTAAAASDQLSVTVDGAYLAIFMTSFGGTGGADMLGRIVVDGSPTTFGKWSRTLGVGGDVGTAVAFDLVPLTSAQVVTAEIASDGASDDYTPEESVLALIKIG